MGKSDNLEPHKERVWAFFHVCLGSYFVSCKCVAFLLSSAIDLGRESLRQPIRGPALFCQDPFTSYNHKRLPNGEGFLQGGWLSPLPKTKNKKLPTTVILGLLQLVPQMGSDFNDHGSETFTLCCQVPLNDLRDLWVGQDREGEINRKYPHT